MRPQFNTQIQDSLYASLFVYINKLSISEQKHLFESKDKIQNKIALELDNYEFNYFIEKKELLNLSDNLKEKIKDLVNYRIRAELYKNVIKWMFIDAKEVIK